MGDGLVRWVLTGMSCCAALGAPARALACGGGFVQGPPTVPPELESNFVTGHRMAYAVSDERTVLFSKLEVQGTPSEFSWVLPVRPGAYLEVSHDSWFAALDAVTTTVVRSPDVKCAEAEPASSVSCGCGAGATVKGGDSSDGGAQDGHVTVVSSGTVGPYETVTLAATDGDDLTVWLNEHGYSVPESVAPVISAYVSEGFDFIALRLQQGVSQVTPIRVVTPGRDDTLPLRLVAAGAGSTVPMTLYFIGEGRFGLRDLHASSLELDALSWDFASSTSNYAEVRGEALGEAFGASFLTTFARPAAFTVHPTDADGMPITFRAGNADYRSLASLYLGLRGNLPACPEIETLLRSPELVTEASASNLACGEADDIAAAFIGMHPSSVWLTRLELELPRSALSRDCVVEPVVPNEVSNRLVARRFENAPDSCVSPIFESGLLGRSNLERGLWIALFGFAALSRVRRRGRA